MKRNRFSSCAKGCDPTAISNHGRDALLLKRKRWAGLANRVASAQHGPKVHTHSCCGRRRFDRRPISSNRDFGALQQAACPYTGGVFAWRVSCLRMGCRPRSGQLDSSLPSLWPRAAHVSLTGARRGDRRGVVTHADPRRKALAGGSPVEVARRAPPPTCPTCGCPAEEVHYTTPWGTRVRLLVCRGLTCGEVAAVAEPRCRKAPP